MKLVENVEEFLHKKANLIAQEFVGYVADDLRQFELNGNPILSPVEQMFYIEWYARHYVSLYRDNLKFYLEPQFKDKSTGKYTIDFRVDLLGYLMNTDCGLRFSDEAKFTIDQPRLGIEVDGHIWHEKTKEQVQNDKERERFLISNEWKLLRFTGSEVFRDPTKCLEEVDSIAVDLACDWYKELKKFDKGK